MDLQTNGGRSLASVVAEQLAATLCRESTSSTPDVVEAVNLTGSTSATTWTSQTPRPCMASALQVSVRRREARGSCSHARSNAADFAAVRECSPLPESLAFLRIRTLTNSDERAAEVWGFNIQQGHGELVDR
jgi:hypothetical protein